MSKLIYGDLGAWTNSREVAKRFSEESRIKDYFSLELVCREVHEGAIDRGIVPVWNKHYKENKGWMLNHIELIERYRLSVVEDVKIPIIHDLCVRNGLDREDVGFVVSHEQALEQCKEFLDKYYPEALRKSLKSTGQAAELISNTNNNGAAICNPPAREHFRLRVLEGNILPENESLFWVVGR